MMTPNSWSRWIFSIEPGSRRPSLADVRASLARFGKALFGADAQFTLTPYLDGTFTLEVHAEGTRVLDPLFVFYMTAKVQQWAEGGWGPGTAVTCPRATIAHPPVVAGAPRILH